MIKREEPRITQVEQGNELSDRNQPIYNLLDNNFTIGISASKWLSYQNEAGDWVFGQEYVDLNDFLLVSVDVGGDQGAGFVASTRKSAECEVIDAGLADKLEKAVCLPRTEEM